MATQPLKRSWKHRLKMVVRHTWLIVMAGLLLCAGLAAVVSIYASTGRQHDHRGRTAEQRGRQRRPGHDATSGARPRQRAAASDDPGRRHARRHGGDRQGQADFAVVRHDIGMPKETAPPSRSGARTSPCSSYRRPSSRQSARQSPQGQRAAPAKPAKSRSSPRSKRSAIWSVSGSAWSAARRPTSDLLKSDPASSSTFRPTADRVLDRRRGGKAQHARQDHRRAVRSEQRRLPQSAKARSSRRDLVGRAGRQLDHRRRDRRVDTRQGAADVPGDQRAEAIAGTKPGLRSRPRSRPARSAARHRNPRRRSRRSAVNHYLVARKKLGEDVVADFTKHLFSIRQTLVSPKCRPPRRSKHPTPQRTGRCRCIRAPPPTSTAN